MNPEFTCAYTPWPPLSLTLSMCRHNHCVNTQTIGWLRERLPVFWVITVVCPSSGRAYHLWLRHRIVPHCTPGYLHCIYTCDRNRLLTNCVPQRYASAAWETPWLNELFTDFDRTWPFRSVSNVNCENLLLAVGYQIRRCFIQWIHIHYLCFDSHIEVIIMCFQRKVSYHLYSFNAHNIIWFRTWVLDGAESVSNLFFVSVLVICRRGPMSSTHLLVMEGE